MLRAARAWLEFTISVIATLSFYLIMSLCPHVRVVTISSRPFGVEARPAQRQISHGQTGEPVQHPLPLARGSVQVFVPQAQSRALQLILTPARWSASC